MLHEILAAKRDEVTLLHQPATRNLLRRTALDAAPARDFTRALRRDDRHVAVVAEIKRRSPSKGPLAPDLDPARTAKAYETGGAAAISVLTDAVFFDGSVDDLRAAREACGLPVLRKDFVIDEVQVFEARAIGADAVLLIAAALPDDRLLADLHTLASELGLAAIVEAHDAREIDRALSAGANVVGVNSRDLATFREDLDATGALAPRIPPEVVAVAESAVRTAADAERMAAAGYDAVLVGEALVRAAEPEVLLRAMAGAEVGGRAR